jgi:mRNA interferase HigB
MWIIKKAKLVAFWTEHPRAKTPLEAWYALARDAEWENFAQLRADFPSADRVGKHIVFDIGGNKYRLITAIHFNTGKVFLRFVLTHKEYDDGRWKND